MKPLANKFLSNTLLSKFKKDYELETLPKIEENLLVKRIKEDHQKYIDKAVNKCLANNSLPKRLELYMYNICFRIEIMVLQLAHKLTKLGNVTLK